MEAIPTNCSRRPRGWRFYVEVYGSKRAQLFIGKFGPELARHIEGLRNVRRAARGPRDDGSRGRPGKRRRHPSAGTST